MGKALKDEPPNRLRELRQKRKWTLAHLAELADTSLQKIQRLEKREQRMTLHWMYRLAAALDCEPIELIGAPATNTDPGEMMLPQSNAEKAHAVGEIVRQLLELDQVSIRRIREHLAAQADVPPELGLYEEQADALRQQLRAALGGGNDD